MFKFNYNVGDIKNSDLGEGIVCLGEGSGGKGGGKWGEGGREVGKKGEGSGECLPPLSTPSNVTEIFFVPAIFYKRDNFNNFFFAFLTNHPSCEKESTLNGNNCFQST